MPAGGGSWPELTELSRGRRRDGQHRPERLPAIRRSLGLRPQGRRPRRGRGQGGAELPARRAVAGRERRPAGGVGARRPCQHLGPGPPARSRARGRDRSARALAARSSSSSPRASRSRAPRPRSSCSSAATRSTTSAPFQIVVLDGDLDELHRRARRRRTSAPARRRVNAVVPPGRRGQANARTIARGRLADAGVASPDAEARWGSSRPRRATTASNGWAIAEATAARQRAGAGPRARWSRGVCRASRCSTRWVRGGLRELDLLVDEHVLIPRPETEWVVEVALEEAVRFVAAAVTAAFDHADHCRRRRSRDRIGCDRAGARFTELPRVLARVGGRCECRGTLEVGARANVSPDAGRRASASPKVRGSQRCPESLRGELRTCRREARRTSAEAEVDGPPPEVAPMAPPCDVSGPTGLEAIEAIVGAAPEWLGDGRHSSSIPHRRSEGVSRLRPPPVSPTPSSATTSPPAPRPA